jgi:glutamate dehydrogenase (NADP+)
MAEMFDIKVNEFMAKVIARNPGESEYHQAVQEVVESLMPFILRKIPNTSTQKFWREW